ncbi:MAG: UvrD-helicase domain-containing protein [Candidatus Shapirobacteria bacterium]|nr:UvrD-helicase domain-containing protein [Candidatus Shapirobacteria bacterium]
MLKEAKKLNSAQKQAVEHLSSPLLIVAGAGTGKTTVITEKIKYLIAKKQASPEEILALTFTEKAALEMEERVDIALPYGYTDAWIMTFHAFCDRILKDEAAAIGLDPGFVLMSQSETVQFLTDHLFDLNLDYFRPLGNPNRFITGLLNHFSRLQDEDITPKQYFAWAKQFEAKNLKLKEKEVKIESKKHLELAQAYWDYESLKQKESLMDFGDLITQTLKLFRRRPNVLAGYQNKFKFFLVDEFQDTNIAQYHLIKLLVPPDKNSGLSVVADDSQSIYRFRGAAVSNVLQFMADYKQAKSIVLTKNYRSGQKILDAAYRLIQHNNPDTLEARLGIDKNLQSLTGSGEGVEFVYTAQVNSEAEEVAKIIESLKEKRPKLAWSDFAILVRANNHAGPFMKALSWMGIPYQFLGPGQLFRQEEIKNLIAYLFFLADPGDDASFYRLLAHQPINLSGRDLALLGSFSRKTAVSLFKAVNLVLDQDENKANKVRLPSLSLETQEKLDQLLTMVNRHWELAKEKSAGQLLFYFLEDSGLLKSLTQANSPREEKRVANIAKFFDRLSVYEMNHDDASLRSVVSWLRLALDLGESPAANNDDWFLEDKVNILTVHSAKGLEFGVVFLVNLVSGRFPTHRRREQIPIPDQLIREILPQGDYHQQEERRLFYVGMTRAKERLFLTASRVYGEGKRSLRISPFVYESLGREAVDHQPPKTNQLSLLKFKTVKIEPETPLVAKQPIDHFSFSQITAFEHCPAQYRHQYLQKIPIAPSGVQSFGITIHQTLHQFFKTAPKGKTGLKDLLNLYQANWLSFGYASSHHEKRLFKEGRTMLERFYQEDFNQDNLPHFLERKFNFFLTEKIKIAGVFDRVDKRQNAWEIIDYKTGQPLDQKQANKSLQMNLYLLAAADRGILGADPKNLTGTFYFLATGQKVSVKKTRQELAQARKNLVKTIEQINQSDFTPKPGFWCDFCPFKMVCDQWE